MLLRGRESIGHGRGAETTNPAARPKAQVWAGCGAASLVGHTAVCPAGRAHKLPPQCRPPSSAAAAAATPNTSP